MCVTCQIAEQCDRKAPSGPECPAQSLTESLCLEVCLAHKANNLPEYRCLNLGAHQ